jgi:hypothetical protein
MEDARALPLIRSRREAVKMAESQWMKESMARLRAGASPRRARRVTPRPEAGPDFAQGFVGQAFKEGTV